MPLDADDWADLMAQANTLALAPFAVRMKAIEAAIADLRAELRSKAPGDQRIRELEAEVAQLTDTIARLRRHLHAGLLDGETHDDHLQ